MNRTRVAAAAWMALSGSAAAAPVLPATMTVEVTSVRNGVEAGKIVANTRPGERVLLRDEHAVPYMRRTPAGRTETANLAVGLVTVVVPEIREGNLVFVFSTTVRHVSGYEGEPGAAGPQVPSVAARNFEAVSPSAYAGGTFTGTQDLEGTGFAVRVKVKAIPR